MTIDPTSPSPPDPVPQADAPRNALYWLGRFWSVAIPLVIFSFGHWSGGAANILIAFAAGLILTCFYLWRRDLVANMIGHGLVDFVANVLPALFS